jgi:hypothetical protein
LAKNTDAATPNNNPLNPLCTVLITNLLNLRSACKTYYTEYGRISFETPSLRLALIFLYYWFVIKKV